MSQVGPQQVFSRIAGSVWYYPVIRGVVAIIFGVLALTLPLATIVAVVLALGAFWLVDGVIGIVDGIRWKGAPGRGWRIFFGVVSVLAGLVLLVQPGLSAEVLVVVAGVYAIVGGIAVVVSAVQARGSSGWGWMLASGVLLALLGVVILAQPGIAVVTLTLTLGVWAIVAGILLIVLGFQIRRAGRTAA